MALNWNIEDCANLAHLKSADPDGWPVTDCLIWGCMIVGIDKITDQTAETFWHRIAAWEAVSGPINTSGRRIEPRDIAARIGLRTNASRLTDAQFRKKITDRLHETSLHLWKRTGAGMLTRAQLDDGQRPATQEART